MERDTSSRPKPGVMAAFNQGQVPTIACINNAHVALGVDFDALIAALSTFLERDFVPVWGTPAQLKKSSQFIPDAWAMLFMDDADTPGALGYHDLTPDGLPLSKVFVKTTLSDGQQVSVTACHELAEMLVDPAINLCAMGPNGVVYAYETADAVEEEEGYAIDGIPMSDFVYPSWFEDFRSPNSVPFDYLKRCRRPFELLRGGYMSVFRNGAWTQIFGSDAKRQRFSKEDRRGHRSEYRQERHMLRPEPVGAR